MGCLKYKVVLSCWPTIQICNLMFLAETEIAHGDLGFAGLFPKAARIAR